MSDRTQPDKPNDRRRFLKGAALTVAATVAGSKSEAAPLPAVKRPVVIRPNSATTAVEAGLTPAIQQGGAAAATAAGVTPGSDFMVDVLRSLQLDYVAVNPGSTFRGLHESVINYGNNTRPEMLTVLHEEVGSAMSHGYAKAAGKPMCTMLHGTVGLLHAAYGIFQCWCDRVPMIIIVGQARNPVSVIDRPHSAQDMGALVRDFVKWDDEPLTLQKFADSAAMAYRIAMTPPMGPVLLSVDQALMEVPIRDKSALTIHPLSVPSPPQGDLNAVREAARLLVNAQSPLIQVARLARTPKGWDLMIQLAELLQAPVDVGGYGSWKDFPNRHPLYGTGGPSYAADVTLGLELNDMSAVARAARRTGAKTISICSEYLFQGRNVHDFGNYSEVDIPIAADGEATLPSLIDEIQRLMTSDKRTAFATRGAAIAATHKQQRIKAIENARFGWDESPISVQRMIAELGAQIKDDDWVLGSGNYFSGDWQRILLNFDRHSRYNGDCAGHGIGYDTPASVGVALANKGKGRLTVAVVGDGDINFVPGALWTAAHHKIPLLFVVHNNRAYQAEVMIVQRICSERGRGTDRAHIGSDIANPNINYARMAQGYGVFAEAPVTNPADLGPALARALAKVRAGEPALVDVVSQARG